MVRIHPRFQTLIGQLRTVTYNDRGVPDKKKIAFDLGDCFLMAVWFAIQSGVASVLLDRNIYDEPNDPIPDTMDDEDYNRPEYMF